MRPAARSFASVFLLVASLSAVGVAFGQKATPVPATPAELTKDPAKWNAKRVRVIGSVAALKERTSKAGNAYFTFELAADGAKVNVFGYGKVEGLKDGAKVAATGKFDAEKKLRNFTVKNQLDVSAPRLRRAKDAPKDAPKPAPGTPSVEILK